MMAKKRVTIYDIAKELGVTASYVSRALNNYPSVSAEMVALVKQKAHELNYKQNSFAANLRQGSTRTIGVIVPHINQSFFSDTIAGIEEVCFMHGHSLMICQSQESQKQENSAIETLIRQNVDCIFISISKETNSVTYLEEIIKHDIGIIQFDRYLENLETPIVTNDNEDASFNAVNQLIASGYKKIAFLGGPKHMTVFRDRKNGYLKALNQAGIDVPDSFMIENALGKDQARDIALILLNKADRPDAFITVSDHQSLGVLAVAKDLGIKVPDELGIIGFANETFSELISPSLSSIDQHGKQLGRKTAEIYFRSLGNNLESKLLCEQTIIKSKLIIRQSSIKDHL